MLSTVNKSLTMNATSMINEKVVAYMNATIPQSGNVNINKTIQDKQLFEENKEEVLNDFAEFEKIVYEKAEE